MDAKSRYVINKLALTENCNNFLSYKPTGEELADFILARDRQINAELVELLENMCNFGVMTEYNGKYFKQARQALSQYKGAN